MSWRDVTRAITLHRWWAFAICHLGKDEENRTYRPPSVVSPDGDHEWIAIHAGTKRSKANEDLDMNAAGVACSESEIILPGTTINRLRNDEPPTSAIVAVTRIDSIRVPFAVCGPWGRPGEFGWRLGKVYRFAEPIACGGRQRVWKLDEEQREAIRRARAVDISSARRSEGRGAGEDS